MIIGSLLAMASLGLALITAIAEGAMVPEEEPPGRRPAPDAPARSPSHAPGKPGALRAMALLAAMVGGLAVAFLVAETRATAHPALILLAIAFGALLVLSLLTRLGAWHEDGTDSPVASRTAAFADTVAGSGTARLAAMGEYLAIVRRTEAEDREHEMEASEQFSQVLSSEMEMSDDEEKLVRGAFSLNHTTAHEVMVPRVAILGVELGTPWSEVLDRVRSSEHSRLPVYRETLDDIVGILFAKDILAHALAEAPPPEGWEPLVRSATFIPSTKPVDDQLRDFKAARNHMAIVIDEYGGTAGILTIEDVLEELVGEIRDEHDDEEPPIKSENGSKFWVAGRLPLDELDELLGKELPRREATTVGGLVFDQLGRVPVMGEEIVMGGFRVIVERMSRRTVERVYFERLDQSAETS